MKWFKKLFRNADLEPPHSPFKEYSWEEIIEIMYDEELDFTDTVVSVIYSRDKSKRYIILKSDGGYYKYRLESIMPLGDVELPCSKFPAIWEPHWKTRNSLFGTEKEALDDIRSDSEYKQYFE